MWIQLQHPDALSDKAAENRIYLRKMLQERKSVSFYPFTCDECGCQLINPSPQMQLMSSLPEDRCEHGMFFSGAGACPKCGGGVEDIPPDYEESIQEEADRLTDCGDDNG